MRVLYILSVSWGGIPHYTAELANAISKYCDVVVVKPKDANDIIFSEYVEIVHGFKPITFSRKDSLKLLSSTNLVNILSYRNIENILRDLKPDITHFTELYPYTSFFVRLHNIDKKFPVVCTFHSTFKSFLFSPFQYGLFKSIIFSIAELSKRLINPKKIVVHTRNDKSTLIERGIDPNRIVVIPHGAYSFFKKFYKRNKENSKSDNRVVLYFGYIQENKGLEYLLKAMEIIRDSIPDVKLIIAGEGDLTRYSNLIEKLNKSLEIYNDFIPNNLVAKLFSHADIVVLPYTYHKGYSGVLTIALSFGKPVIVTNVGDLPNIIENYREGIIIPPRNPKALANAIIRILEDDKLRKIMSKNALKKAKELSWNNIAKKHIKIYEEILKEIK